MDKPRILVFSTAYYPLVGGAEVAIKEVTERLPGFEFVLITAHLRPNLPVFEQVGPVVVYRIGWGSKWDKFWLPFGGLLLARKLHRERPFDLVWSMMASQASVAAAWLKQQFPDVPLVLTLQEGDNEEYLKRYVWGNDFFYRWLIRPFYLAVFKQADYFTAISQSLARRALEIRHDVPLEIIPNGVDLEKFSSRVNVLEADTTLKFLKQERSERYIITTSRLVEKNGVDTLIQALKYLPDYVQLMILGSGPDEAKLKNLAAELGLNNRVKFFGHISGDQLPDYLSLADVFVRPSRSEGLGNSFLEAMYAGLPTIGTPVGGIVDFLHEGKTGWLCEVNNPQSIADKVLYILDPINHSQVTEVVKNAGQLVAEKYDWNKVAEAMGKVFTKLCQR